jgi:RNA polymerase sigma-70 factor (ECF subfamily)
MTEFDAKETIEEILRGNKEAYGRLIRIYQQPVYNLAWKMTGSADDARELTQVIFIKAYTNLKRFDRNRKFFSWLYRIALNETQNYLKALRRFDEIEKHEFTIGETPEDIYHEKERQIMIQQALLTLRPHLRSLIVLKYYDGLSYEEISEVTGLTVKKIKSRLFSARQILKERLVY